MELKPFVTAFNICQLAYNDLEAQIADFGEELHRLGPESFHAGAFSMKAMDEVAGRLTFFLASASAFLAQSRPLLRSLYGEESTTYTRFEKRRKDSHASSFAYRLLYELRNFSQHFAVPISSLNFLGRGLDTNSRTFTVEIRVYRDKFASASYDWNKKVLAELKGQKEVFDMLPLVREYWVAIRSCAAEVVEDLRYRIANAANYLSMVKSSVERDAGPLAPGGTIVMWVGEVVDNMPPGRTELLPFVELERTFQLMAACSTEIDEILG